MHMSPCPFCGEPTRLGVITKWTAAKGMYAKRGAFGRCKRCHARGPLVTLDHDFDMRNSRPTDELAKRLVDKAVEAWNGALRRTDGDSALPLFSMSTSDGRKEES